MGPSRCRACRRCRSCCSHSARPPPHKPVLAARGSGISCRPRGWRGDRATGRKPGTRAREQVMKLLYFDDFKLGVLKGDAVVDVSAEVKGIPHICPGTLMNGLIEQWGNYKARLEAAAARGSGVPVSGVRIRPPVPGPRTIACMAVNYMEDGTRSAPAPINAFH